MFRNKTQRLRDLECLVFIFAVLRGARRQARKQGQATPGCVPPSTCPAWLKEDNWRVLLLVFFHWFLPVPSDPHINIQPFSHAECAAVTIALANFSRSQREGLHLCSFPFLLTTEAQVGPGPAYPVLGRGT